MGILHKKIEMAILNLIRFGPQALTNNTINCPVSYSARNFTTNSASRLFSSKADSDR